jgi:hypothetical protein
MAAASAPAQSQVTQAALDLAVVYNPLMANPVGGNEFWMQGGSVQVHAQFWRGLGVVVDVAGLHSSHISASGVGLDLVTATFGPRYTWSPPRHRYALFGQVLAGEATGWNSIFPGTGGAFHSANNWALYAGGGANLYLNRRISVRAFEADWLRTQMPNGTSSVQNNLRLGAGLIFHFNGTSEK